MTRRLLFDQDLSPRLVDHVAGPFPGSLHIGDVGLFMATDVEVLEFAHGQDLVVVTKDKDFADLVTSRGNGPRILWVMLGNVTTDEISKAILDDAGSIHRLLDDPDVQIVQLTLDVPQRPVGQSDSSTTMWAGSSASRAHCGGQSAPTSACARVSLACQSPGLKPQM